MDKNTFFVIKNSDKIILVVVAILFLLFLGNYDSIASLFDLPRNTKTQTTDTLNGTEVTIIMRPIGPLETYNTYAEIQPSKNISEESRVKVNTWFKDNAVSCLYNDNTTKDFLIERLKNSAFNDEKIKKAISQTDLQKMSLDEIRKFYVDIMSSPNAHDYIKSPTIVGSYKIDINKNNLLTGSYVGGGYCGWEAHPDDVNYRFVIDLLTGNEVTLGDVININDTLIDLVKERINYWYIDNGSEDQDNVCWKYIKNYYMTSDYADNKNTLHKETSFELTADALGIFPRFTSHIENAFCAGTHIDFSYSELGLYLKQNSILERLK